MQSLYLRLIFYIVSAYFLDDSDKFPCVVPKGILVKRAFCFLGIMENLERGITFYSILRCINEHIMISLFGQGIIWFFRRSSNISFQKAKKLLRNLIEESYEEIFQGEKMNRIRLALNLEEEDLLCNDQWRIL